MPPLRQPVSGCDLPHFWVKRLIVLVVFLQRSVCQHQQSRPLCRGLPSAQLARTSRRVTASIFQNRQEQHLCGERWREETEVRTSSTVRQQVILPVLSLCLSLSLLRKYRFTIATPPSTNHHHQLSYSSSLEK